MCYLVELVLRFEYAIVRIMNYQFDCCVGSPSLHFLQQTFCVVAAIELTTLEIVPSALTRAWDRQWVLGTSLAALNNPPPPSLPPPLLYAFSGMAIPHHLR